MVRVVSAKGRGWRSDRQITKLAAEVSSRAPPRGCVVARRRLVLLVWINIDNGTQTQLAHAAAPLQYHCNHQLHFGPERCIIVHNLKLNLVAAALFVLGTAFLL
jgi:hypothetical protein